LNSRTAETCSAIFGSTVVRIDMKSAHGNIVAFSNYIAVNAKCDFTGSKTDWLALYGFLTSFGAWS
jgi:hypothetical protein